MSSRRLAFVALVCCALVGCTPSRGVEPTPTITSANPTPAENSYARQQRLDFEAAEAAYRQFHGAFHESMREGGSLKPPAAMTSTATGDYLAAFAQVLEGAKRSGYRETGEALTGFIARTAHYDNGVQLTVCEDTSRVHILDTRGKEVGRGEIRLVKIQARSDGGRWKLTDLDGKKVTKCDGSQFGLA